MLLLAQVLFRLPHQELRQSGQTYTYSTDHQHLLRHHQSHLRVATELCRRIGNTKELDASNVLAPAREPEFCTTISGNESSVILPHWHGGVFLGILGRRGKYCAGHKAMNWKD